VDKHRTRVVSCRSTLLYFSTNESDFINISKHARILLFCVNVPFSCKSQGDSYNVFMYALNQSPMTESHP